MCTVTKGRDFPAETATAMPQPKPFEDLLEVAQKFVDDKLKKSPSRLSHVIMLGVEDLEWMFQGVAGFGTGLQVGYSVSPPPASYETIPPPWAIASL